MPVTKTALATPLRGQDRLMGVRRFDDGTLLLISRDAAVLHLWRSTDNGANWAAYTSNNPIATALVGSLSISFVQKNDQIVIEYHAATSPTYFYRILTPSAVGDAVGIYGDSGIFNVIPFAILWYEASNKWAVVAAPATRVADNAAAVNHTELGQLTQTHTGRLPFDWNHDGDGRTKPDARPFNAYRFGGNLFISLLGNVSLPTNVLGGRTDEVLCSDGSNYYGTDFAQRNNNFIVCIPYNRLSYTKILLPITDRCQILDACHHGGKMRVLIRKVTDTTWARIYTLDTGSGTWDSGYETHADWNRSERWVMDRYPRENVVHLINADAAPSDTDFAYYRVVFNTAPNRPTLTLPTDRDGSASLTLNWTFTDPEGDSQQSYELRRRVGSGAYQYWNGTAWIAAPSDATRLAGSGQSVTLTSTRWRAAGSTDDHWFSIRVRDTNNEASEWSPDVRTRVVTVAAPTITAIGEDTTSPFTSVHPLVTMVRWTADVQQEYRVQTFADNNGAVGSQRSDTGWQTGEAARTRPVTFGADGETGHLRVSVRGFGSPTHSSTVAYTVSLPDPPGPTTITPCKGPAPTATASPSPANGPRMCPSVTQLCIDASSAPTVTA